MRKRSLIVCSILLLSLAACGGGNSTENPSSPAGGNTASDAATQASIADTNVAPADTSPIGPRGRAGASSQEPTFPVVNLNDGKTETAWGALSNSDDVYVYVTLAKPLIGPKIKVQLFSPGGRNHLNEIRIIARNGGNGPWTFIRSRLSGTKEYSEKISVPPGKDGSTVAIELDPSDTNIKSFQTYGVACLRKSKGDVPNHLGKEGTGVYLRELTVEE